MLGIDDSLARLADFPCLAILLGLTVPALFARSARGETGIARATAVLARLVPRPPEEARLSKRFPLPCREY